MIKTVLNLSTKSIKHRRSTVILSIISIAFSVVLLLGIKRIILSLEDSFSSTISGTDLIVGAPNGDLALLLATVFHKGNVNQGISWEAHNRINALPEVDWTIPISLGDSHKGYAVIGTNDNIFTYYRYGPGLSLTALEGTTDISGTNCVIGSKVAEKLGYALKDKVILSHGMGTEGFISHEEDPFTISAILRPTGTPMDNCVIVSLEALDHMHDGFYHQENHDFLGQFTPNKDQEHSHEVGHKHEDEHDEYEHEHEHEDGHEEHDHDHEHEDGHDEHNHDHGHEGGHDGHHHDHEDNHDQGNTEEHEHDHVKGYDHGHNHDHVHGSYDNQTLTGFYLGAKSKSDIPRLQRLVNDDKLEPLLAIMPVITLLELWAIIKPIETMLTIMSFIILLIALGSVLTSIISSLNQRRREMSVLRSIGARPQHIFGLILIEAAGIVVTGILLGICFLIVVLAIAKPILAQNFGIIIGILDFSTNELWLLLAIGLAGVAIGLVPAIKTYRRTLADGLTIKL